ncbi:MAG: amidohydrolase [bacterium]|nr:amidohydrolase [bacterium]
MSHKEDLIDYMQGLDVIDCHEHLRPERDRVAREVDVLTLVSLYAFVDTLSAGLPQEGIKTAVGNNLFLDLSVPLEERWRKSWPYLRHVKYGSYYRPTAIALRDIYGIDDLNEDTWREATRRIREANTPGIYTRILRDRCRIKTCLVQNGQIENQDPADLMTPVFSQMNVYQPPLNGMAEQLGKQYNTEVADLDGYLAVLKRHLEDARAKGAAGFKMGGIVVDPPDMAAAREAFKTMLAGGQSREPQAAPERARATQILLSAVLDQIIAWCGEWDWPVAVHLGIWNDFRRMQPQNMLDLLPRHPGTRFELYHLGMPFAREAIFLAKNFPNAHLNLCWTYAVSEEITRRSINEIIDAVPVNKVFAFGADYIWAVENVYGHMVMARETMAEALADRIERDLIDMADAKHICRLWFHDNPARFYGLAM